MIFSKSQSRCCSDVVKRRLQTSPDGCAIFDYSRNSISHWFPPLLLFCSFDFLGIYPVAFLFFDVLGVDIGEIHSWRSNSTGTEPQEPVRRGNSIITPASRTWLQLSSRGLS
ncbi:hypothetical protein BJX76DRAFT_337749 [Aspergillus varians]